MNTALERWLSKATLRLEEFYAGHTRSPRQGLNKVFAAWKALVASLAQLASELDPGLREELRRRGLIEDSVVKVTTATAPKIIHLVAEKAEQEQVRELASEKTPTYCIQPSTKAQSTQGSRGPRRPSKQRQGSPKGSEK